MHPRKSLSQHYLTDFNIARKTAAAITLDHCPRVVEIGPGYGMLTRFLYERFGERLILLEIDEPSTVHLAGQFPALKTNIIRADILSFPLEEVLVPHSVITGNLPYHITSPIFFKILDHKEKIDQAVFMVQKEVAERICSHHGTKVYGLLSVLTQTFYKTEYLFTISEKVFFPRPKVQSAVIRLTRNDRQNLPCKEALFQEVLKKIFGQRRKMIRNSLGPYSAMIKVHGEFLQRRPEQMSVDDFVALCSELDN